MSTSGGNQSATITGPLGELTEAASISVAIASDEFGQAAMAQSLPVAIASNQSVVPTTVAAPTFPLTATVDVATNVQAQVTLAAAAGKVTRLWAIHVTAAVGTAALNVLGTVTGLGTPFDIRLFVAANAGGALVFTFPYPISASAVNTAVVVTVPAGGVGGPALTLTAFGDQL